MLGLTTNTSETPLRTFCMLQFLNCEAGQALRTVLQSELVVHASQPIK